MIAREAGSGLAGGPYSDPLLCLSLTDAAELVRTRAISPVELIRSHLDHIEAQQARTNAFITICRRDAEAEAAAAEKAVRTESQLGPLHGIPYSVKDTITTRGLRTTMGSKVFSKYLPDEDAICVARSRNAGGILLGKTTTPEFAMKCVTDGALFGATANPWLPQLSCGGSSGGSAVAVATGQGLFSLATDGGGSIRIPASCCGIYGLKPSAGRIPQVLSSDLFSGIICTGVMARSVGDLKRVFAALNGPHRHDPFSWWGPVTSDGVSPELRIGWLPVVGEHELHPEWRVAGERVVSELSRAGNICEEINIDLLQYASTAETLIQSVAALQLVPIIDRSPSQFDAVVLRIAEKAKSLSAQDIVRANTERSRCFRAIQTLLERFDLLITPTLTGPPPPLRAEQPEAMIRTWYPYTFPFNLSGHPALSVPVSLSEGGAPIGIQLIAPWGHETRLLAVASLLGR